MNKKTMTRILAMALCLLMLFLAGCNAASGNKTGEDRVINLYGVPTKLVSYDGLSAASTRIFWMTHSRLLEHNYADGKPLEMLPGLATEWEWLDDTTMELKLRDDVKFHNGEPFTSDDVVFTVNELLLKLSQAAKITMVDHAEAIDDYTVRIYLNKPNVDFERILGEPYFSIVNREAIEAQKDVEGALIGTGAYKITGFAQSDYVDLERNEEYWGEPVKTKYFHFEDVGEVSTGLMKLQNGEMDAVTFNVNDVGFIDEDPNLDRRIVPNQVFFVCFNTSDGPGADENFRKAVAYAINKTDFINAVDPGYSKIANSIFTPNNFGYDDNISPMEFNLDLAKQYLEKSEYKGMTISFNSSFKSYGEMVQAMCKEAGITIELEPLDGAALSPRTRFDTADFEATIGCMSLADYGDDCRRYFYPGSNVNKAILTDDRIVELIDNASVEKDEAARKAMYSKIQQLNREECWYLPLCLACETTAFNAHLKGVAWDYNGNHVWTYAYIEE